MHEDWGECSEDWAGACRWGGGGGGGILKKCSWGLLGCLGRPTPPPGGRAGVGKQYTSSYDHDM